MNKRLKILLLTIAIVLIVAGAGYLAFYYFHQKSQKAFYDELQSRAAAESLVERASDSYASPVDFPSLWNINQDIYAWIEIEDTDIRYPIVQSPADMDDNYYLDHTIEGTAGYPGAIYTQRINAKDFTDFNTVIYGHDMDDGSMFAGLHRYEDEDFFQNHRTIHVYLPEKELTYQVFASVIYDDRLILFYYDNDDPASCRSFLDTVYDAGNGIIADDVSVSENDQIITLSTCLWDLPDNRYLVLAKKVDEQP